MWQTFLTPFVAGLRGLYELTNNLGFAIIIFTIITRLLLLPLTLKSLRSQKKMQALSPQLREIQRKYGKDREKSTRETMELYKREGVNPAGGCLPILIQLPIFFAIYGAVTALVKDETVVNKGFLWISNLGLPDPMYILPVLSITGQLLVQLMATPRIQDPQQAQMSKVMLFMPFMMGIFAFTFPSGAVLYWVMGSVIAVVQQYFTNGFGSLPKYLPFLPDKTGFMTPPPPAPGDGADANGADEDEEKHEISFWDALGKLTDPSRAEFRNEEERVRGEELAVADVRKQLVRAPGHQPKRKRR
jgi:YidC/Oxa1 family membrane protein insertase